jgi:multidrug/hemolysin transport system permease protein
MAMLFHLASRNLKVYLRDRTAVFFSLLSVFIIIGLYAIFLGNTTVRSLENAVGKDVGGVRFLVDSWIMAGILVVNSITVTLGMFGTMIDDESKKRLSGFLVAPVSRSKLVYGYLLAAVAAGILLSVIALILAEIYIAANGGSLLTGAALLKVLGLLVYNVISSACMVFFLVSWFRSASGFSTLSTILGTIIGFITGIYLPIGVLPQALQTAIVFVPATHAAALMRQIMMETALDQVFKQAPPQIFEEFTQVYGVRIYLSQQEILPPVMLLVIGGSGLLFLILSVIRMSRRKLG